jgi:hypothetical protein
LLNADHALAPHHGVWQLTDEAIDEPAQHLHIALSERQMRHEKFRVIAPGQAWDVGHSQ